MGPSLATEIILKSKLNEKFYLIHLDTSDHRELSRLSRIDLRNIYLALLHYLKLFLLLITKWPKIVYIPISQTTIGYIRDSGFILIAKLFRKKVICHLRGGNFKNWYSGSIMLTRFYVRMVHNLVDGQIVLGETLRDQFSGLVPPQKLFVVPNGRDFDRKGNKSVDNKKIKVLFLANHIPSKGVLETLKAVPLVLENNKNVEFNFAGGMGHQNVIQEMRSFIDSHNGLPVSLKGLVLGQNKYDLLGESDIFVFPTYYAPEGHPWVIIEAMAAGLPIVSTNQGAIAESVIDGFNGFIVEKRNSMQIAEKVTLLAEDKKLRERMGQNSRKQYEKYFTEAKMVENLSRVFSQILS